MCDIIDKLGHFLLMKYSFFDSDILVLGVERCFDAILLHVALLSDISEFNDAAYSRAHSLYRDAGPVMYSKDSLLANLFGLQ